MSGHTVTWMHDRDTIVQKIVCNEDEWALCRIYCGEGCEDWSDVSADNKTHRASLFGEVHAMKQSGECNYVTWIDEGGPGEFYEGGDAPVHDGPVKFRWDGDCWFWDYANSEDEAS